jgi:MSHA pilin protein MshB
MLKQEKNNRGFTLIELVIVVVILGLLAATAIPRFLDVTENAENATVEGVSGGFATGVGLVRAQWEIEARPEDNDSLNKSYVTLDGIQIGIDSDTGYPTGQLLNDTSTEDDVINDQDCEAVFNLIMQSAPSITTQWIPEQIENFRYFTNVRNNEGSGGNDICQYFLIQSIKNNPTEPLNNTVGNGFVYDPRIGQVIVFSNN